MFLAWVRALSTTDAAVWSLLSNVVVFLVSLLLGEAITRIWAHRRVAPTPPPVSRLEVSIALLCVVLNALVMFVGWWLFVAGVVRVDDDPRFIVDALVLVLAMDLAMFITHRLAHHPFIYRWVHALHHRYDSPRVLTLFVLHPLEVLGFGALWIALLCSHAFSLNGILVYLTINTVFGVLGHVGVEPFSRWPGWLGSSTFHAGHHRTPTQNYGFYTALWDRLSKRAMSLWLPP